MPKRGNGSASSPELILQWEGVPLNIVVACRKCRKICPAQATGRVIWVNSQHTSCVFEHVYCAVCGLKAAPESGCLHNPLFDPDNPYGDDTKEGNDPRLDGPAVA